MVDRHERLVQNLFEIALANRTTPLRPELRRALHEASDADFEQARVALLPHKLFPLLAQQLEFFGLIERVPAETRHKIIAVQKEVRVINAAMVLSAMTALRALERAGEQPLVIKGMVFANDLYPDSSARPMGDIDLVAAPGRHEVMLSVLARIGFRPVDGTREKHAVILQHPSGVRCDAHETLSMFDGQAWDAITRETTLTRLHGIKVRVLEPSAMLAHLATHMGGHAEDLGPVLLWIADTAFVLRRYGSQIDPQRAARLCLEDRHWALFLRTLGLLRSVGEELPGELDRWSRKVPPLTFGEVLRLRRTAPWGLPHARGLARVVAQSLTLKDYKERPSITAKDVVYSGLDALTQRLVERRLKRPA